MKILAMATAVTLVSLSPAIADPITPVGEVQRGSMVTLQGNVERILDTDEFRLTDDTGNIRVYVGPNWVPAKVGDSVKVSGFVDDGIGPLELYAHQLTHADGTVVEFKHQYD